MSELRWLRLWTDVIDDPKLLLLAPSDRWYFLAITALKRTGMLDEPDSPEMLDRKVGLRLRLDDRETSELRRRLLDVRLIDSAWQPCGWGKRQFQSDEDATAADRQRRLRERQRNALVTRDVTEGVTRPDTDTEQIQSREEGRVRAPRAATAKRIPADFALTPEREALARAEAVNPEREFARFCDHWRAASGSGARKHDWDATWRNWCRRAKDMAPRAPAAPPERTWRPGPED